MIQKLKITNTSLGKIVNVSTLWTIYVYVCLRNRPENIVELDRHENPLSKSFS